MPESIDKTFPVVKPNLKSPKRFAEDNPDWSEGAIRWAIFNEDKNGLKETGAIVRFGTGKRKRVFIDENRFYACICSQN